jgi:hypothetical protein
MDDATKPFPGEPADLERASRDPVYRKQLDDEDRKYDDTSEGIDWDDIIATTQDEFEAGDYAYSTEDYATEEEAMAALKRFIHQACEEGRRAATASPSTDTARG